MVNVVKVDKQATLSNESLDDLLVLNSDKISIRNFNPDHSIDRWWEAKTRRPHQKSRKKYAKRYSGNSSTSTDDGPPVTSTTTTSASDAIGDESDLENLQNVWTNGMIGCKNLLTLIVTNTLIFFGKSVIV